MNYKSGKIVFALGIILSVGWLTLGFYYFIFNPEAFDFKWARGELGDYVGGGLGGITVVFIIYTVWLQIGQISSQQNESFEAGVFRIFEALKLEVEGLSVRIISKALKTKRVLDDDEPFKKMLTKFHGGDRTVFLRAMQKSKYCNIIRSTHDDKDLEEPIKRFEKIMLLLKSSLEQTAKNSDADFLEAIRSTEIYVTYLKCFK